MIGASWYFVNVLFSQELSSACKWELVDHIQKDIDEDCFHESTYKSNARILKSV